MSVPSNVPRAQPITTVRRSSPRLQSRDAQRIVTRLKSEGARAGAPYRSSAFSIPIATAAKETMGRKGSMIRVRTTVISALPAICSNPGARA